MPAHHGVRVHDDQGCAPIPPRIGEQHPKDSISLAELRTFYGALEDRQLLAECQILERDRRCPPQISARDRSATTSAASMGYPVSRSIIGSNGRRSDSGERQELGQA
jgi:hypothetical protein